MRRCDLYSFEYFFMRSSSATPALCPNKYPNIIVLGTPEIVLDIFDGNTVKTRANVPTKTNGTVVTIHSRISFSLRPATFDRVYFAVVFGDTEACVPSAVNNLFFH